MKPKLKRSSPVPPRTAADHVAINAALEEELDLAWTEKNQAAIQRRLGAANYAYVQEIIAFTSNQEAWLNDASLSSAADKVSGRLSQRYPSLTPAAIFKIVNQATYGWR
jgi:hypothetical protein